MDEVVAPADLFMQLDATAISSFECELCSEVYDDGTLNESLCPRVLHCGHTFCQGCLIDWTKANATIHPPNEATPTPPSRLSSTIRIAFSNPRSEAPRDGSKKSISCPSCRQDSLVGENGVESLPKNFELLRLQSDMKENLKKLAKMYSDLETLTAQQSRKAAESSEELLTAAANEEMENMKKRLRETEQQAADIAKEKATAEEAAVLAEKRAEEAAKTAAALAAEAATLQRRASIDASLMKRIEDQVRKAEDEAERARLAAEKLRHEVVQTEEELSLSIADRDPSAIVVKVVDPAVAGTWLRPYVSYTVTCTIKRKLLGLNALAEYLEPKPGLPSYPTAGTRVSNPETDVDTHEHSGGRARSASDRGPGVDNTKIDGESRSMRSEYTLTRTLTSAPMGLYGLTGYLPHQRSTASRRYSDFEWFHQVLCARYPHLLVPALAEKQILNFEAAFIEERRKYLQAYLSEILKHPMLGHKEETWRFLTESADDFELFKSTTEMVSSERRSSDENLAEGGSDISDRSGTPPRTESANACAPPRGAAGALAPDVKQWSDSAGSFPTLEELMHLNTSASWSWSNVVSYVRTGASWLLQSAEEESAEPSSSSSSQRTPFPPFDYGDNAHSSAATEDDWCDMAGDTFIMVKSYDEAAEEHKRPSQKEGIDQSRFSAGEPSATEPADETDAQPGAQSDRNRDIDGSTTCSMDSVSGDDVCPRIERWTQLLVAWSRILASEKERTREIGGFAQNVKLIAANENMLGGTEAHLMWSAFAQHLLRAKDIQAKALKSCEDGFEQEVRGHVLSMKGILELEERHAKYTELLSAVEHVLEEYNISSTLGQRHQTQENAEAPTSLRSRGSNTKGLALQRPDETCQNLTAHSVATPAQAGTSDSSSSGRIEGLLALVQSVRRFDSSRSAELRREQESRALRLRQSLLAFARSQKQQAQDLRSCWEVARLHVYNL